MLSVPETPFRIPPDPNPSDFDKTHIKHAIFQAKLGQLEGGIPIGAALVTSGGIVVGVGRNRRVQRGSAIHHGETDCLENIGSLPAHFYEGCTMFTTLSPCIMCTGAILLFGIKRVVMAENSTFIGAEQTLKNTGIEVVNLGTTAHLYFLRLTYLEDIQECKDMMTNFIAEKPALWKEDIGEV